MLGYLIMFLSRRILFKGSLSSLMLSGEAEASDNLDAKSRVAITKQLLSEIEKKLGGRVGVSAVDTKTGLALQWRGSERFVMHSVFKWLLSAYLLHCSDTGSRPLQTSVVIKTSSIVGHSDQTKPFAGTAVTIETLCFWMMSTSDNGAANTLLDVIGGPSVLTSWLRSLGDTTTRQDTYEPGPTEGSIDPRNTTTPDAMLALTQKIWMGSVLSPGSRETLLAWLQSSAVGGRRLRAGVPSSWVEGDRTGTGDPGVADDVAIFWPDGVIFGHKTILVTSFLEGSTNSLARLESAQASIGQILANLFRAH
ncbi:class A beta-lactamase [Kozakia baliensis]|uniref:Beta-lactamase n=1 Tax=Kozakia baliensis TaxID=153496 RepID=A0A1D8UWK6_9PROT|nr:class A beta-lactamase [Kozakia baliensis]AOX17976.1 hypothetical protein A0U89_13515 [Kozakia baliensis]GBR23323.1 beta-lactamase [Kozakia baliensis NRIC 0488]GEL65798.1 beta-lactamase [Kozakia baliensis]